MLVPRDYQSDSAQKAIDFMRLISEPGVLVLTTAAGKSIIVSLIAHVVQKAKKRVLCLAPNGDLVTQNAEKYRAIGERCSLYSASVGQKHTGHPVVFATPISVANNLDDFDEEYALIVIDECHGVSEDEETTYKKIIAHLSKRNPKLRVLGLTATPMRGKEKLIGSKRTFKHIIHELPHQALCDLGWVLPYKLGHISQHYEMAGIKVQSNGRFSQSDIDEATLHKERLTRAIVNEVVATMENDGRKCGMFFASSIKHAEEVLSYLPSGILITGKTPKGERKRLLDEVRNGKHKYVVNVGTLTTGTDLPIVDTIVLLRAMEAVGLLLQILGRGCRLYNKEWKLPASELNWKHEQYDGKRDCLVLDHGQNIERFSLDDDLTIAGLVEAKIKEDTEDEYFEVECPECNTPNRHTAQRCTGIVDGARCTYRFVYKECESCQAQNSPSARHCWKCDHELLDPNRKLTLKASVPAGTPHYVEVLSMDMQAHFKNDEKMLRVNYNVTDGEKEFRVSEYFKPQHDNPYNRRRFNNFAQFIGAAGNTVDNVLLEADTLTPPARVLVKKPKGSKYYSVESWQR